MQIAYDLDINLDLDLQGQRSSQKWKAKKTLNGGITWYMRKNFDFSICYTMIIDCDLDLDLQGQR